MAKQHQASVLYQDTDITDKPLFIVRLNAVDCLTLTGVLFASISAAMILQAQYSYALAFLYIAVLVDAIDGILARRLKLERPFGRYLDSFVDSIDYLMIPALFLYCWGFDSGLQAFLLVGLIAAGFIRLAVFNEIGNIDDGQNGPGYLGAPVFWIALALGPIYALNWWLEQFWAFALLMIVLPIFTLAMLHNQRYYKFKQPLVIINVLLLYIVFFVIDGLARNQPEQLSKMLSSIFSSLPLIPNYLLLAVITLLPVLCAGVIHMLVVSRKAFPRLAKPLHVNYFGQNKTWRGMLLMPLASAVFAASLYPLAHMFVPELMQDLLKKPFWLTGALLGLAYSLAELPNSALKRALNIPSGALPKRRRWFFITLDQLDSAIGCCLVLLWLLDFNLVQLVCALLTALALALVTKRLLFQLGLKQSPS